MWCVFLKIAPPGFAVITMFCFTMVLAGTCHSCISCGCTISRRPKFCTTHTHTRSLSASSLGSGTLVGDHLLADTLETKCDVRCCLLRPPRLEQPLHPQRVCGLPRNDTASSKVCHITSTHLFPDPCPELFHWVQVWRSGRHRPELNLLLRVTAEISMFVCCVEIMKLRFGSVDHLLAVDR